MTRTPGLFICHTEAHATALRRHVVHQLFRMKQSADDGVIDPSLITLLESFPKDDEADQNDKTPQRKKAGGEKTSSLKTAKGDDSTPAKTTGKKRKAKKKGGAKKAASKKRKGADDGSDDDTGSEFWPSSSEPDEEESSMGFVVIGIVPCFVDLFVFLPLL